MITVLPVNFDGVPAGVRQLIHLIQNHDKEFIGLIKVKDVREHTEFHTFIAVFREPGSIGQLVAFVAAWGTNWGPEQGGEGSYTYQQMMSFIEDTGISALMVDTKSLDFDHLDRLRRGPMHTRMRAWEEVVMYCVPDLLDMPWREYPVNRHWPAGAAK